MPEHRCTAHMPVLMITNTLDQGEHARFIFNGVFTTCTNNLPILVQLQTTNLSHCNNNKNTLLCKLYNASVNINL